VLDLAGAGIKLSSVTQSSAHFDFTGSGSATKTGWITQGEGLLVLDGNPNAPISVDELVGAASGDGFADLAALNGNGDGVIDASDPAFARLSVWVDGNGNGQLDPGELASLGSLRRSVVADVTAGRGCVRGRARGPDADRRPTQFRSQIGRHGSLDWIPDAKAVTTKKDCTILIYFRIEKYTITGRARA
jgi:hypothetical protein